MQRENNATINLQTECSTTRIFASQSDFYINFLIKGGGLNE